MTNRSVLLSSNYEAWPEAFNGQAFAFLNVIRAIENADLLCPQPAAYTSGRGVNPQVQYLWHELIHRVQTRAVRALGRPGLSNARPVTVEHNYDLFMFMCQFPLELTVLNRIHGWRKRCGLAVAYLLETWPERFPHQRAELKLLDHFDHVFVLNAECIPALQQYTRTPVSFLATACDTLLASPWPELPDRHIDVLSIGRRMPSLHEKLVELSSHDGRFLYVHDVVRGGSVTNWHEHRLQSAKLIKRSKYFIAYDFSIDTTGVFKGVRKQALATRYFEGAAGGAVLLGSRQSCPQFAEYFDWPDAVIPLPPDIDDVGAFLSSLDAQRTRMEQIRSNNMIQSLRRHDWAHRWLQVLDVLGLEHPPMLAHRINRLNSLAAVIESTSAEGLGFRARVSA
jgi:hypothetical protein